MLMHSVMGRGRALLSRSRESLKRLTADGEDDIGKKRTVVGLASLDESLVMMNDPHRNRDTFVLNLSSHIMLHAIGERLCPQYALYYLELYR
jgi:hypothetical protein